MSLDSSELPPAGTQRATQPRPAGTCPIKQQIEQQASNSPPGTPHLCQPETTRGAEDALASSLQLLSRRLAWVFQSRGPTRARGSSRGRASGGGDAGAGLSQHGEQSSAGSQRALKVKGV